MATLDPDTTRSDDAAGATAADLPDDAAADDGPGQAADADHAELDAAWEERAYRLPGPRLGWLLLVLGAIGLLGSAMLAIERVRVLADPTYTPGCSINPFLTCGPAMESWQGSLFGFPNPFLGVAAFPVVVTTGVVLLSRAKLPRWYWLGMLTGASAGLALVLFLIWTSLTVLRVLCPWCMVVWVTTIPIFWYVLVHCVQERFLGRRGPRSFVVRNRAVLLTVTYAVLVAVTAIVLRDSWQALL